jgi:TolA-binding protein
MSALVLLVAAAALAGAQAEEDTLRELAEQLAEQRSLVEQLSDRLDQAKGQIDSRLEILSVRRADLEEQILAETRRLERIQEETAGYRSAMDSYQVAAEALRPLLVEMLPRAVDTVRAGIPFQTEGRLEELEEIERLASAGELGPFSAVSRLWNFLDGELRLSEDIGLYRQAIRMEEELKLAEVARLGMVLLYFRTLDGEYGYAVPSPGGWTYRKVESGEERRQIADLFDSLRKNLRRGYFHLPNPLVELRP